MVSFIGHVLQGTLFLYGWGVACVELCGLICIGPQIVLSPVPGFERRLKYLKLYLIVIGGFIDLCIELLIATHFMFFVRGVLDPSHMNNFEHSGMLLMFFIFCVLMPLSEKTSMESRTETQLPQKLTYQRPWWRG